MAPLSILPAALLAAALAAPDAPPDAPPRVSMLTFDPGDDLFAAFGHVALVATPDGGAPPKVYSFGNYDFARPDAKWRYACGHLDYWVSVSTLDATLERYRGFDRGAALRDLDLSPRQAEALVAALERATLPQNRTYRYNHVANNCCTKVRDLVDGATGGALRGRFSRLPASDTYRGWLRRSLAERPLWLALIDFSLGPSFDRPIDRYEEEFLPSVLSADLDAATLPDGRPLVSGRRRLLPARAVGSAGRGARLEASLLPGAAAIFSLACLALALAGARPWARRAAGVLLAIFGLASGACGALLVFLQLGVHVDAHGNANHLLAPAAHLWLVIPGVALVVRGRLGPRLARVTRLYLAAAVACLGAALLLALGYQDNLRYVALAVGPAISMMLLSTATLAYRRRP